MPTVSEEVLFDLMRKYGWSEDEIADYQRFNGLEATGQLTPATARSILQPRFCGHPDRMNFGGRLPKFPFKEIKLFVRDPLPGFSKSDSEQIVEWSIGNWAREIDIRPQLVTEREPNPTIVITAGHIDGEYQVLAWSELAPKIPCLQQYDTAEKLFFHPKPQNMPNGMIHAGAVCCHELGHALGIEHLAFGNLMQPQYTPQILVPQAGDILAGVQRYGKAILPPPSPDGIAVPDGDDLRRCLAQFDREQAGKLLGEGLRLFRNLNRMF